MTSPEPRARPARAPARPPRAPRLATALAAAVTALVVAGPARAHTPHDTVEALAISPAYGSDQTVFGVFKLSEHTVFARSIDGGRSWDEYGLAMVQNTVRALRVSPDFAADATAFAATSGGVWRTLDGGDSWQAVNAGLASLDVRDVALAPTFGQSGLLLAATAGGMFRSTDGGDSWVASGTGLTEPGLTRVAFGDDDTLFAGNMVLHRSNDAGLTWFPRAQLPGSMVALAPSPEFAADNTVALAIDGDGVLISTAGGPAPQPSADGLEPQVNDLCFAADGRLYAATRTQGVMRAAGPFQPWVVSTAGLETPTPQTDDHWRVLAVSPDVASDGTVFVGAFEGVFRSVDAAQTWTPCDIYHQRINRALLFSPDYRDDRTILAGNYGGGLYVSPDDGDSWEPVLGAANPGTLGSLLAGGPGGPASAPGPGVLDPDAPAGPRAFPAVRWSARADGITSTYTGPLALSPGFADDGTLFYGHVGLWRSHDRGLTWEQIALPPSVNVVRGLAVSPDFPVDQTAFFGTAELGVWKTVDGGDSWTLSDTGLPADFRTREFVFSRGWSTDGTVFVASRNLGVWRSTDFGTTWQQVTDGLTANAMRVVAISPDYPNDHTLFVGSVNGGLFRTTDGGDSWQAVNTGIADSNGIDIEGLALSPEFADDHTLYVSTQRSGVYRSTDRGDSFASMSAGLPLAMPRVLAISPDFGHDRTLLLSTHDWVWRSRDAGASWHRLPGYVRVPDNHPQVLYDQLWGRAAQPMTHAASVSFSKDPGDAFEYEFYGDAIHWYATLDSGSGQAEVRVDGQVVETVELYAPRSTYQQRVFSMEFEAPGWHVLRVTATGGQHPFSTGSVVQSDGFSVAF